MSYNIDWVHPSVYSTITDNSSSYVTATGTTKLFVVFTSEKGKDNKIQLITTPSEFEFFYGTPDIKKYGQSTYQIINWLTAGGAVYCLRVLPDDAGYSNAIFNIQTKVSEKEVKDIDGNTVIMPDVTLKTCVTYTNVNNNNENSLTNMLNTVTGTTTIDNFTNNLLFAVIPIGRGNGYNDLGFKISLSTQYDDTYEYRLYNFEVTQISNTGSVKTIQGPFLVSFDPDALSLSGESMYIKSVLDRYCDYFTVIVSEKTYEKLGATINDKVNPNKIDFITGISRTIENDKYETFYCDETQNEEDIHMSLIKYQNGISTNERNIVDSEDEIESAIVDIDNTYRTSIYNRYANAFNRMKLALSRFKKAEVSKSSNPMSSVVSLMKNTNLAQKFAKQEIKTASGTKTVYNWNSYSLEDYRDAALFGYTTKVVKYYKNLNSNNPYYYVYKADGSTVDDKVSMEKYKTYCDYTGKSIELLIDESQFATYQALFITPDNELYGGFIGNIPYEKIEASVFLTGAYGKLETSVDILEDLNITPVITAKVEQGKSTFIDLNGSKALYTDGSYIPLEKIIVDSDLNPVYSSSGAIAVDVKVDEILTAANNDGNTYINSLTFNTDKDYIATVLGKYTYSDEAIIAKKFIKLVESNPTIYSTDIDKDNAKPATELKKLNALIEEKGLSKEDEDKEVITNALESYKTNLENRNSKDNYKVFKKFELQLAIAREYLKDIQTNKFIVNAKTAGDAGGPNEQYTNVVTDGIGTESDDSTQTTAYGKLKKIEENPAHTISDITNVIDEINTIIENNFPDINAELEYITVSLKDKFTDVNKADADLIDTSFNDDLIEELGAYYLAATVGSTSYKLTSKQKLNNLITLINENYLANYNTALTHDIAKDNDLLLEYNLYTSIITIEEAVNNSLIEISEAKYNEYIRTLEIALITYITLYAKIHNITLKPDIYKTDVTNSKFEVNAYTSEDEETGEEYKITQFTYKDKIYGGQSYGTKEDPVDSGTYVPDPDTLVDNPSLDEGYNLFITDMITITSTIFTPESLVYIAVKDIDLSTIGSTYERSNGDSDMSDNFIGRTYQYYDEETDTYKTYYELHYLKIAIEDDLVYNYYANKNTITLEDQLSVVNQNINNLQKLINERLDDIYELFDYNRITGTNVTKLNLISSLESIQSYLLINEKNQIKFASLINQINKLETERYEVILNNVQSEQLDYVASAISEATDILNILEVSLSEFTDTEIEILNDIQKRNSSSEEILAAVAYSLSSYNSRRTSLTNYLNELKTKLNIFITYYELVTNQYSIEEDKSLISVTIKLLEDFLSNLKFGCKLILAKMSSELLLNTSSELKECTQSTLTISGELADNTTLTSKQIESIINVFIVTLNSKKQLLYVNCLQNYDNNVALLYGTDGSIEGLVHTDSEVERLISRGYRGLIDDELTDKSKYPIDLVLDANYSSTIKNSLITLVTSIRDDFMAILDTGITGSPEEAINYKKQYINANTFRVAIFAQDFTVNDVDYTAKVMKVTTPYFLSSKIVENDMANGIYTNFVGPRRGTITGFESISYNPNPEWKEQMYNSRVNYIETDLVSTRLNCNLTSQYTITALSNINNVRSILRLQREVEDLMKDYIFEWNDDSTIAQAQQALDALLNKWKSYRVIKSLSGTVYSSDYDRKQKLLNVSIEISFTDLIERIHIDITVNN